MNGRVKPPAPPGTGQRLLVIEDETVIATELAYLLEDLGHSVIGVGGTEDGALSLIRAHRDEVDIVFLDANLAGKPALEVAAELRRARIPYVMASGYEDDELRRLGFDADCTIGKPFREDEVVRAVEIAAAAARRQG